jgi:uncharacterized membrane protein YeiB
MLLLTSRLEASGKAADVWYRRNIWLLVFGIAHAYLLWLGEILYPYAMCGFLLFPFRKLKPKGLLIAGSIFMVASAIAQIGLSYDTKDKIENGRAALKIEASGGKLTDEQKDHKKEYEDWLKFNHPSKEELAKDKKEWHGTPLEVIKARAKIVGMFHSVPYYHPGNWDIWSMMLIGMGLFQLGWLSGARSEADAGGIRHWNSGEFVHGLEDYRVEFRSGGSADVRDDVRHRAAERRAGASGPGDADVQQRDVAVAGFAAVGGRPDGVEQLHHALGGVQHRFHRLRV